MKKTVFALAAFAALLGPAAQAQSTADALAGQRVTGIARQPGVLGSITPLTANNSNPQKWRITSDMGFDGVARLLFDTSDGSYVCSGTLLAGGLHVLTAAHCADNFTSMQVDFGVYGDVAKVTRGVAQAYVHPAWTGALGVGNDIAVLRLDAPVTTIQGFKLSTTNDVGKDFLIMGYGSTTVGASDVEPNWNDWGYGHWGYNRADVTGNTFNAAIFGDAPSPWGEEYIADYDALFDQDKHNTLQILADLTGNAWSSDTGEGKFEALIAGGDSGGGDFVWNGSEWVLSGVHSWGWQICPNSWGCDISKTNSSSWGDLSGSTAVFSHVAWINGITAAVPEPASGLMLLAGLGAVGGLMRRRKSA